MAGITDLYRRFANHDPEGYDHPSLTKAFNDLAKSPIGRDIVRYYKDELRGPLFVTDDLPPGVLGQTTYSEIVVHTGASAETLAHEMRHAYQNHAMKLHGPLPYNPFYNHIQTRMIEADAFSFACLNAITRWRETGYKTVEDVINNEPDIRTENEAVYLIAFHAATVKDFDPDFMPRLMRKIFERYYGMIAVTPGISSYEQRAMDHGVHVYKIMDKYINPSRQNKLISGGIMGLLATTSLCSIGLGYFEPAALSLSGMFLKDIFDTSTRRAKDRIVTDFSKTTEMIDELTEKLGVIPGMKGNYLIQPNDIKLSDPFFTHVMNPKHHDLHKEWSGRIQAGIDRRALSNNAGPK
jgi:hypothetical protein